MKGQPRRDWSDARAKVDAEGCCRNCKQAWLVEAAHIIARKHDQPKKPGNKTLYVHPDAIFPLCQICHARYDSHQLDALRLLTPAEEARAVLDAGGLELARVRLAPGEYRGRDAA